METRSVKVICLPVAAALLALSISLLPGDAVGQETEGPLLPAGRLRLEAQPAFSAWSSRFGAGEPEPLGQHLVDPTGALLFPGILDLQEGVRTLLDGLPFDATLGSSSAEVSSSIVRLPFRVDIGVFDWLTVGATVPVVRHRTEIIFAFRADAGLANLGLSPAITHPGDVLAFTDDLRNGAAAVASRAQELCAESPSSEECLTATRAAGTGEALLAGFTASYGASPFFLLEDSDPAEALRGRVDAFNVVLVELGLAPLTREPLFAPTRLSAAAFDALFSDTDVGLMAPPLRDRIGVWELGDIEVHAALRLFERRPDAIADDPGGLSYQVGAGALVRLGTGRRDDPNVFLDLSSGDGQLDLEGRVFATVSLARAGLWANVRYGVQRPRTLERRIGPPELVLVPALNRATVEWQPGSYLSLDLVPRFHLTPELALTAGYRLYRKERDAYTRRSAPPELEDTAPLPSPPLFTDASLLALGTEEHRHELGWGLLYSSIVAWEAGRARLPFEARFSVRWAVAGAGQAPRGVRSEAGIRLFRTLWGG